MRRDFLLAGVFDGHGKHGLAAAEFAAEQLPRQLMRDRRLTGCSVSKQLKARVSRVLRLRCGASSMPDIDKLQNRLGSLWWRAPHDVPRMRLGLILVDLHLPRSVSHKGKARHCAAFGASLTVQSSSHRLSRMRARHWTPTCGTRGAAASTPPTAGPLPAWRSSPAVSCWWPTRVRDGVSVQLKGCCLHCLLGASDRPRRDRLTRTLISSASHM